MRADDGAAASDDSEAEFEARPRSAAGDAGTPELRLVDLARLSIVDLAEQFGAALEAAVARRRVPLSRLADWLVMAAHLALLRSRLLLPADGAEAVEARREAEALRRRLADREFVRRLADWLERRPRLGREVFARGVAEDLEGADRGATPAADTAALLRACLAVLERPDRGDPGGRRHSSSGGCRTPWRGSAGCCPG
jgi:segregation and condensation protein A